MSLQAALEAFRRVNRALSYGVILALKPLKLLAYRSGSPVLRRLILTPTTFVDFAMVFLDVQNETMQLHWKAYKGNFLFGRGVMVTDHASTALAIAQPSYRGNDFMGVSIVTADSGAFASNSGILTQCPITRKRSREYLDAHVFPPAIVEQDAEAVRARCAEILADWRADPEMTDMFVLRSASTRITLKLLTDVTVSYADAGSVTRAYIRRFVELSLFSGTLPVMLDLLGTQKQVRQDAYFKLKDYGIDIFAIEFTLFAAMFSVGTLVMRCIEDVSRFGIDYAALDPERKRRFVIEAARLYPTVTTVHRIVERDEVVDVAGLPLTLTPGDQVVYPFYCSNRDPAAFPEPDRMDLERPAADYDKILSWSKGPHECPAKDLSIAITMVMLDELARRHDLAKLRIFNPAF